MPRTLNLFPNLAAFLDMLAYSEGTIKYGTDEGYNVIVGGSTFNSYSDHPNKLITINSRIKSTAAGRYQILGRYWPHYKDLLNVNNFSPISQDACAIQLIKEQGAFKLILDGHIKDAIVKCANIWASLPGAGYGQRENNMENLIAYYHKKGGTINEN